MSLINTEIKPFKAEAFKDGKFITVSDEHLRGQWSVVFFYPADFTFVCPTELEDLADNYAEFQKLGVEIYSVSTDTHFAHKAWHDTSEAVGKIAYTMVGDPTGAITRNFGVMIEDVGLADRGTFVVDPEGKIQIVEITASLPRSTWSARSNAAPSQGPASPRIRRDGAGDRPASRPFQEPVHVGRHHEGPVEGLSAERRPARGAGRLSR
jgi:peroxiredoxin (alkyl hydroperoxide reductase subunit C)